MPRFLVPWTINGSTYVSGADDEAHAAQILEARILKEGWASIAHNDHDGYDVVVPKQTEGAKHPVSVAISDRPENVVRLPSEPKDPYEIYFAQLRDQG